MNKIVYNACYGGFGLSREAVELYLNYKGIPYYPYSDKYNEVYFFLEDFHGKDDVWGCDVFDTSSIERHDPILVQVVEELGDLANGSYANLQIYETEANQYFIEEYDGIESVVVSTDDYWTYIKE